ncbi:MFS transporter [Streptomyces fragilis]|uniref:MFS transporter n=1 Tax=Streptomyces fragilis TaxID=67301 RepID=A0ABV2YEZ9_9ACTN|nr:MFS transporter [Streptomyces fragilis]
MTTLQTSAGTSVRTVWSPSMWALLAVLAGNMLIDALEVSVLIVALPAIGADLALPVTSAQWLMTGFALGFGGLMLFAGRVVALLGRRRVYLLALLAFALASLAAGFLDSPGLLLVTRVVKGFCAALTAPTGLSIITTAFREGADRNRAVSVYTFFGACGFTAGLVLSGLLTPVDWHWVLAFPAPVVLVLFAAGLRLVPADPPSAAGPRHYDLPGAAALSGALLTLVYAVVHVPEQGWGDARVVAAFAGTVVLGVCFVLAERSAPEPLIPVGLLANAAMIRSALAAAALNGSHLGLLLILSYRTQHDLGWGPLRTACAFLPAGAPLVVTALLSGRLVARFGAPRLVAAGLLLPTAGYAWYQWGPHPTSYATGMLPALLLVGAGFVLAFAALNLQATAEVPAAGRGAAGAVYQTAVQTGALVTLSVVAAVMAGGGPAAGLVAAVGGGGFLVALTGLRRRAGRG